MKSAEAKVYRWPTWAELAQLFIVLLHLLPGFIAVGLVVSLYFEQPRDFIWNSSVITVLLQVLMICFVQDEFISTFGRQLLDKLVAFADKKR